MKRNLLTVLLVLLTASPALSQAKGKRSVTTGAAGPAVGVAEAQLKKLEREGFNAVVKNDATTLNRVYHLDRGFERIEEKLSSLGADIKRVKG